MTDKKLREIVKKIRTAKLCVPESSGATFVLADGAHLEIRSGTLVAVLCSLLDIEMHD